MPKVAKALSDKAVKALANKPEIGFHPVGGTPGLALQVKNENAASWILRTAIAGKRSDAAEMKGRIQNEGFNPIVERRRIRSKTASERGKAVTFREVAREFIQKKSDDFGGKNIGQRIKKMESMLDAYVYPTLGQMLPADIELAHIQKVLDPIWREKTETANRARLYIEKIIDLATVKGLRTAQNPARWAGNLDHIYTKPSKISPTKHRESLP